MLDDSRKRFAYLPRTNPAGKSDRLYSVRNSSLLIWLVFFIYLSLSFARNTSTNDSNCFTFIGMHYH